MIQMNRDRDAVEVVDVWRWQADRSCSQSYDALAEESPLEIRVRGQALSVTMRTPGHDADLALGFLLSEGLIRHPRDVSHAAHCRKHPEGNVVNVFLRDHVEFDINKFSRHVFASSSCGLCGKATIDSICTQFDAVTSDVVFAPDALVAMADRLRAEQAVFNQTGGLHAAALFDESGALQVAREDIGRHNAVDKVLGYALREGLLPLSRSVLLVSGRASFEIMQKALSGGVAVVAAVSAPSSLAVDFARDSGQTLVGFLRDRRMNVYTFPERIQMRQA